MSAERTWQDLAICKCGESMFLVHVNQADTAFTWRCQRCGRRLHTAWDETRVKPGLSRGES